MGSLGRQQQQRGGTYYYQPVSGAKFQTRKAPTHPQDSWQYSVPSWERKFCTSVGSVPWKKLLDTKRYMYLYENVVEWDDSAGKEAFNNAKERFWANINGLPCDISLPDPDVYIDEIDWNSGIDPELVLDLEREPKPSDDETKAETVILGNPLLLNQSFACTGWGDAEEEFTKNGNRDAEHWDSGWNTDNKGNVWEPVSDQNTGAIGGWGDAEEDFTKNAYRDARHWDSGWKTDNSENPWGPVADHSTGGWDSSRNKWENNNNPGEWNANFDDPYRNMDWKRAGGVYWGDGGANNMQKDGGGRWNNSRYKTSRFHGGHYHQKDRGWRNGGRRNRVNVGHQNSGTWKKEQTC